MKRLLSLLVLAFLSLAAVSAQDVLKVMSFNVRQSLANDGQNSWRYRRDASKNMLALEHPDLLGLQETCPEQVDYFDDILRDYERVGVGRDDGKHAGEMMAIYYDRSLFKRVAWGTFWLSETPNQVSQGWDGACKRTCTWIVLRLRKNDQKVIFLNTHLDHIGPIARREGVRLIADRITKIKKRYLKPGEEAPVFLTADFNTSSVNPIFDVLKKQLQEARATARVADTGYTFNEWGKVKAQLEQNGCDPHNIKLGATGNSDNEPVIDHIFYSGARALRFSVLRGDYGAPYISDHYPVMLEARLGNKAEPRHILAIGNSFSVDAIEQNLWEIAHEAGVDLTIGNLYIPGCSLGNHARCIRDDDHKYEYRKVVGGQLSTRKSTSILQAMADEPWEVISMQQVSDRSGQPDSYEPYLTELIDSVRHHSQADLAWHMTWAYHQDSKHSGFLNYGRSQKAMYLAIRDAARQAVERHHFDYFIPAGTAIQLARAELGDVMTRDGYHLNLQQGRYCAALTWAEVLLGIDARTVKYAPRDLDETTARAVRQAAHAAAQGKEPTTFLPEPLPEDVE